MKGPSRIARLWLSAALPEAVRDEVMGDLHEEHARRAPAGAWQAELWYWGTGAATALSLWGHRARAAWARGAAGALPAKGRVMDQVAHELRMALRGLLRRPAVSLLVVVTLAVGLAANATLFSAFDALLLRPMDYPHQDRLVRAWQRSPRTEHFDRSTLSPADFRDWQQAASAFDALVGLEWWSVNVQGEGGLPERVQGFQVSPAFFDVLGTPPALGRGFRPDEAEAAKRHVVVISDALWKRSFGGDPGLVGRSLLLDGVSHVVIGIAPPRFLFPEGAELWAPLSIAADAPRDRHYLSAIGRLAPGVSLEQGRAQLAAIAARLAQDHPQTNAGSEAVVVDLQVGYEDAGLRGVMAVWQAAALFLLLIACVNVANLTLARATERQGELAVRLALGAARGRIVRQLVTEGLVAAAAGAIVSLPLTLLATRAMRESMPADVQRFVPGWAGIDVDGRTFAFTLVIGGLAMLVFSAWPAIRASRTPAAETLRQGGRGASGVRQRGRNVLVVAEVACALALVVGAGLAWQTAQRFTQGPLGFDPDGLLTFAVSLPERDYADEAARAAFARRAAERLRALPGVDAVAIANVLPSRNDNSSRPVFIEGGPAVEPQRAPIADNRVVAPGYFAAMGIPVVGGRELRASDDESAERVVVVSRSFAQRHWPGLDPLGRRIRLGQPDAPVLTVVGVCGDVVHQWFARREYPTVYRPIDQAAPVQLTFGLRTAGPPEALVDGARQAITAIDSALPASGVNSMRQAIARSTIGLQFGVGVMGAIALVALLLAVSGIYGVMAYRVALREGEFGVRLALGASGRDLLRLTLRQAALLTGTGVAIGLGLSTLLGSAMVSAFQGAVRPDALAFVGLPALLFAVALCAAWLPARAVLAIDPSRLLRSS